MADEIKNAVEITEHSSVEPAPEGSELVVGSPTGDAEADAGAEADGAEGEEGASESEPGTPGPKEQLVHHPAPAPSEEGGKGGPAPVEGERPRETALRLETERLKGLLRKERAEEIRPQSSPVAPAPARTIAPEKAAILAKYKAQDVAVLKELLPVLAEELGFVRGDELKASEYGTKSDDVIKEWQEAHPETEDPVIWDRIKAQFGPNGIYQYPKNPADYKKILDKIHQDIFHIQPAGDKGAITAQNQKIHVASGPGNSGPSRSVTPTRTMPNSSGLRLDGLRGFSDEEKENIARRAG